MGLLQVFWIIGVLFPQHKLKVAVPLNRQVSSWQEHPMASAVRPTLKKQLC